MIDKAGFRPNVGIMIADGRGRLLWARRVQNDNAWQFPQGGIDRHESPEEAMYRELYEEVGLEPAHVDVIASTRGWLQYRLPSKLVRRNQNPVCIGQKQKWFLLKLTADSEAICFDRGEKPEFSDWQWVSYWYPVGQVVSFKRDVYRQALKELCPAHMEVVRRHAG